MEKGGAQEKRTEKDEIKTPNQIGGNVESWQIQMNQFKMSKAKVPRFPFLAWLMRVVPTAGSFWRDLGTSPVVGRCSVKLPRPQPDDGSILIHRKANAALGADFQARFISLGTSETLAR